MFKKHIVRIALGLGVVLLFLVHAAEIHRFEFMQRLEAMAYDARVNLTMPGTRDNRVVIVDLDEKSLAEEGRWPWGRHKVAALVDRLFDQYKVSLVGFDVVFAERDESSGLKVLDELARQQFRNTPEYHAALTQLKPQLDRDQLLVRKIQGRPVVLGYFFNNDDRTANVLPEPVLPSGTFKGRPISFVSRTGYASNLPELQKVAYGAGNFSPFPDLDGVFRRVPMLMEYKGAYYEPLSLAVVRALLGNPPIVPEFADGDTQGYGGLEWIRIGNLRIPVDDTVSALIPYRGKQGSFKYVSASDVLHGRVPAADLQNAIVLVGTTAQGLFDLRSTPVQAVYPGVEVHANLIAGILDQNIKQRPAYVLGAEVAAVLLVGLSLTLLLPLLSPFKATLLSASVLSAVIGSDLAIWQFGNVVLPLASLVMLIIVLFALNMSYGFFVESRTKRQITGLFGQYVPPELVEEMARDPESFTVDGESREMTVLFSDVRNFTTISEGLEPRQLTQLMNEYLTPMTQVIHRTRGTIDKYIGDAIMAFWGAPLTDPDHARHAILAGLEMQTRMHQLRAEFASRGWPELHIGVGINSGMMSVGNMGSQFRQAYTVMGDAVNLASRLEGLTKEYGVAMMVGEDTRKAVPDVAFRELDRVRPKGKQEPVAIYEPIGAADAVDKDTLHRIELFHQVLKLYRAQNWDMAELQLLNLKNAEPDCKLYGIYLERIAFLRANPPGEHWDGVWVFHTK